MIAEKVTQTNIHTPEPAHAPGLCRKQNPVTDSRQKRVGRAAGLNGQKSHPVPLNMMEREKTLQKPVGSLRKNKQQKILALRFQAMNSVKVIKNENDNVLWLNMPGVRL